MRWSRVALVFRPEGQRPWLHSHASNPVALALGGTRIRVFFGTRDSGNRSQIAFLDMDLAEPSRAVDLCAAPVLTPGPRGAFDDSGVSMGCLLEVAGAIHLYYLGWNLGVTVPFRNTVGLALADGPDAPFRKISAAPVLDRSKEDPFSISYPWVLPDAGGYWMWYGSTVSWGPGFGDMTHAIRHATSPDGRAWARHPNPVLVPAGAGESVVVRPCVIRDADCFRMWFSARGPGYRLGYAESEDGLAWKRRDEDAGFAPSGSGWDSSEIAYPHVFDCAGARWMLYNGNGFGRTGIGLATLVSGSGA
jgi:hypothetical protein